MEISFLGRSSFKIRGKAATIVTDPFDASFVGQKFPKVENFNIVTISHDHADHNCVVALGLTKAFGQDDGAFIVAGPGEYEIAGVRITGIVTWHDDKKGTERGRNTVYKMEIDNIAVCHLGDLGHKLSEEDKGKIGPVDILLIPVGGTYTIDADAAGEVVAQLEPRIVIPMHYGGKDLDPVDKFLKEMGAEGTAEIPKLTVSAEKLPETTTIILLENPNAQF